MSTDSNSGFILKSKRRVANSVDPDETVTSGSADETVTSGSALFTKVHVLVKREWVDSQGR